MGSGEEQHAKCCRNATLGSMERGPRGVEWREA